MASEPTMEQVLQEMREMQKKITSLEATQAETKAQAEELQSLKATQAEHEKQAEASQAETKAQAEELKSLKAKQAETEANIETMIKAGIEASRKRHNLHVNLNKIFLAIHTGKVDKGQAPVAGDAKSAASGKSRLKSAPPSVVESTGDGQTDGSPQSPRLRAADEFPQYVLRFEKHDSALRATFADDAQQPNGIWEKCKINAHLLPKSLLMKILELDAQQQTTTKLVRFLANWNHRALAIDESTATVNTGEMTPEEKSRFAEYPRNMIVMLKGIETAMDLQQFILLPDFAKTDVTAWRFVVPTDKEDTMIRLSMANPAKEDEKGKKATLTMKDQEFFHDSVLMRARYLHLEPLALNSSVSLRAMVLFALLSAWKLDVLEEVAAAFVDWLGRVATAEAPNEAGQTPPASILDWLQGLEVPATPLEEPTQKWLQRPAVHRAGR